MTHAALVALVLTGSLVTAFITWAFLLFSGALTAGELTARRCMWLLEIWMVVALGGFYVLTAKTPTERKLWEVTLGIIIAAWIFRGARARLARRKEQRTHL